MSLIVVVTFDILVIVAKHVLGVKNYFTLMQPSQRLVFLAEYVTNGKFVRTVDFE